MKLGNDAAPCRLVLWLQYLIVFLLYVLAVLPWVSGHDTPQRSVRGATIFAALKKRGPDSGAALPDRATPATAADWSTAERRPIRGRPWHR